LRDRYVAKGKINCSLSAPRPEIAETTARLPDISGSARCYCSISLVGRRDWYHEHHARSSVPAKLVFNGVGCKEAIFETSFGGGSGISVIGGAIGLSLAMIAAVIFERVAEFPPHIDVQWQWPFRHRLFALEAIPPSGHRGCHRLKRLEANSRPAFVITPKSDPDPPFTMPRFNWQVFRPMPRNLLRRSVCNLRHRRKRCELWTTRPLHAANRQIGITMRRQLAHK
jgi:hypothetical protein